MAPGEVRWGVFKKKKNGRPYKKEEMQFLTKEVAEEKLAERKDRPKGTGWNMSHPHGYVILE